MFVALVVAFIVIYLTIDWFKQRPKNFPPGPPALPIVGCVPFMPRKLVHYTMAGEWRKKYGPVVGCTFGSGKMVAICGPEEVLEVLKRDEFQGRPKGEFVKERSFDKYLGVFFSDGPFWVEQRRFTLRHLRDFGFGKKSMQNLILDEVEDVIKEIGKDSIFQANGMFGISTLNVLWGMLAGTRYSRDDAELKVLLKKLNRSFRAGNPTGGTLRTIFPFLKKIIPGIIGHSEVMDSLHDMQDFFRRSIHDHKKTIDESNPRDYMDVYVKEMNTQNDNPDTTFTEEGLITICLDLFAAGGETTTSSIEFSLMYMVLYPEVQKAVHKELDAVVGQNRRPTLEDRPNLHYIEAVMTELLRVCSIAPLTPPHRAVKDTQINGYSIPKDTFMTICLYSLFQDKEHWGDPEVFRPERFINKEGKYVKDDWMIPFGAGKRVCLGEVLARSTVFLFFATLLQEFTFTVPEGEPTPSEVPLSGFTIAPQPFKLKATKRF